ncbi:class I SAM-dependent methyltransferase [Streptomyces sioyaensis]|uniref:class I SAM-dependent methyltransferase n=1 Tax=Streptomyces sioyaensis TaxID=67364 RepID=UPI0037D3C23F
MHRVLDRCHRTLFAALSLLGARGQGRLLHWYFDWWHRRPDPWGLAVDDYEQFKYATTLGQLPVRPYRRILDVGCSEGAFTHRLAAAYPHADVTGADISERALARARTPVPGPVPGPRFVRLNIVTAPPADRFDLVFCAELLYYLGRPRQLRRACAHLAAAVAPGGLLVLVHPWPEARRFCAYAEAAGLCRVTEHVERGTGRPFAVSVYEAAATAGHGAVDRLAPPGRQTGRGA